MLIQNNTNPEIVQNPAEAVENGQNLSTPEAPAPQEVNRAVEQPTVDPVQDQVQQTQVVQNIPQTTQEVVQEPVIQDDTKVDDAKDTTWTQKAKDVIKEYADQPYKEEEQEGKLQKSYLKERFNVEVDEDKK
jgi:hypothetical protein